MEIRAKEVGRQLVITLGGPQESMTEDEAEIASRDVRRIIVPPVTGKVGQEIWGYYAQILFGTTDASEATTAVRMTKMALGAWADEDASPHDREIADAQWARVEDLRWQEGETVCQLALYWNAQGGGQDVIEEFLAGGHPKAQETLMKRNSVWNVYSRLRMLTRSPSSDEESATPPADSSGTTSPSGTSSPDTRDAFGIRRPA